MGVSLSQWLSLYHGAVRPRTTYLLLGSHLVVIKDRTGRRAQLLMEIKNKI